MRFDGSGQLRRQENVLLLRRVVHVDQHPALGVWVVEGVVSVSGARLALFCLGGLAADDGVVLAGAQMDHICGAFREGEEQPGVASAQYFLQDIINRSDGGNIG